MRTIMTMSIPVSIRKELDALARKEHVSRSSIIQMALNEFLFNQKFERLHKKSVKKAQALGIFTDEDVFQNVS